MCAGPAFVALSIAGALFGGEGLALVAISAALMIPFANIFSLPQMHLLVAVICTASPTATNGYILARQLGGDAPFSANLIAVQTLLSILTMPLVYMLTLHLLSLN